MDKVNWPMIATYCGIMAVSILTYYAACIALEAVFF